MHYQQACLSSISASQTKHQVLDTSFYAGMRRFFSSNVCMYSCPQSRIWSRIGSRLVPKSVSEYSTLGGHFAVDVASNNAIFLQFAQLQREHALGDTGEQALQLAEAFFAGQEME